MSHTSNFVSHCIYTKLEQAWSRTPQNRVRVSAGRSHTGWNRYNLDQVNRYELDHRVGTGLDQTELKRYWIRPSWSRTESVRLKRDWIGMSWVGTGKTRTPAGPDRTVRLFFISFTRTVRVSSPHSHRRKSGSAPLKTYASMINKNTQTHRSPHPKINFLLLNKISLVNHCTT